MPTTRETVLAALHARLQALAAPALRGEVLPERIPATGLIIVRDGIATAQAAIKGAARVRSSRRYQSWNTRSLVA